MPQIASPGTYFLKFFRGGMPPDPPRGSCPPGTRHTRTGYFTILADYFKICGEHCLGPLLSAPAGASKRETPTSNLTESTVQASTN